MSYLPFRVYVSHISPRRNFPSRFSRELSIVGYGDETTRKHVEALHARAFIMVLPSAMGKLGEVRKRKKKKKCFDKKTLKFLDFSVDENVCVVDKKVKSSHVKLEQAVSLPL